MPYTLSDCIELIQETTDTSEIEVMNSLMNVYTKTMSICESSQEEAFELMNIFQEADESSEKKPGKIRQFVQKVLALIKRIIEKITSMIDSIVVKRKIKKVLELIRSKTKGWSDDQLESAYVPSPITSFNMNNFFNDFVVEKNIAAAIHDLTEVLESILSNPIDGSTTTQNKSKLAEVWTTISRINISTGMFNDHISESENRADCKTFMDFLEKYSEHCKDVKAALKRMNSVTNKLLSRYTVTDKNSIDMDISFANSDLKLISKNITEIQNKYIVITKGINKWLDKLLKNDWKFMNYHGGPLDSNTRG